MNVIRAFTCGGVVFSFLGLGGFGITAEPKVEPPKDISYYKDIRPIFQQHCLGCHQPAKAQGGLVMTDYVSLMKKGDSGDSCIVPGKPKDSLIFEMITSQDGKPPVMPKGKDPLIERDVALIKKWIEQGAKDDTPASAKVVIDQDHPPVYTLAPVVTAVAFSPDGSTLAVSGFHEVLLYKADGSAMVGRLVGLSERIQSLAFSPDGKSLAVAAGTPCLLGEVQIWDVASKKLKLSLSVTYDTLYGVSWSPDGTKVAFGCADNTLRAIDAKTGKQVLFQGAHSDWVLDTVFSVDNTHVVSVSRDGSMKLTEVATQRFIDNITSITPGALKGGLMALDRHPNKEELLIGGSDGEPKIYQMHRDKKRVIGDDFNLIRKYEHVAGRVYAAKYSPDGSRFAVGTSFEGKGEVRVYYSASRRSNDPFLAISSLPRLISHGMIPTIAWTDFISGRPVSRFEGQKGGVYALSFRPDGKVVASGGFDGVIRLNDVSSGKMIKEFVPFPVSGGVAQAK